MNDVIEFTLYMEPSVDFTMTVTTVVDLTQYLEPIVDFELEL